MAIYQAIFNLQKKWYTTLQGTKSAETDAPIKIAEQMTIDFLAEIKKNLMKF